MADVAEPAYRRPEHAQELVGHKAATPGRYRVSWRYDGQWEIRYVGR